MVTKDLSVGLEYTPTRREVLPRVSWFVRHADGTRPAVTLGWTSDRLSTDRGQAVFLTASQPLFEGRLALISSFKYETPTERLYFPFGANVRLHDAFTLQAVYDGNYTHWLLLHAHDNLGVSLLLARSRHPGIQFSVNF